MLDELLLGSIGVRPEVDMEPATDWCWSNQAGGLPKNPSVMTPWGESHAHSTSVRLGGQAISCKEDRRVQALHNRCDQGNKIQYCADRFAK